MKSIVETLMSLEQLDVILVLSILFGFGLAETLAGFLAHSQRKTGDWIQEVFSFLFLSLGIKPMIVGIVYGLGFIYFPEWKTLLSSFSFSSLFFMYILVDDLLQYWYHRTAHETHFLWKLHRAHHQAEEMGYFVSYRNAMLYYILMPNIWWVGFVVFAGGAKAVALGLVLKQLVIIGSHSRLKWDKPFYKYPMLTPFIRIIERIIITPSFHHAHHGTSLLDNTSDPNGNFGNMFSIWDQLFGSANFRTNYPKQYGLQYKTNDDWTTAYFYPFVTSKDKRSSLHKNFTLHNTKTKEALWVQLTKGEDYLWCACGHSKQQPFCDGSHHGTRVKPQKFTAKRTTKAKLCNCKASKNSPFCDDTHLTL